MITINTGVETPLALDTIRVALQLWLDATADMLHSYKDSPQDLTECECNIEYYKAAQQLKDEVEEELKQC